MCHCLCWELQRLPACLYEVFSFYTYSTLRIRKLRFKQQVKNKKTKQCWGLNPEPILLPNHPQDLAFFFFNHLVVSLSQRQYSEECLIIRAPPSVLQSQTKKFPYRKECLIRARSPTLATHTHTPGISTPISTQRAPHTLKGGQHCSQGDPSLGGNPLIHK